mmetsp:Transcript_131313/g.311395  ORF Transcript_131313/g.311395 Transcript_131313/m.311395 type:complete len:208 (+) Transcript_131313:456-1079(+)
MRSRRAWRRSCVRPTGCTGSFRESSGTSGSSGSGSLKRGQRARHRNSKPSPSSKKRKTTETRTKHSAPTWQKSADAQRPAACSWGWRTQTRRKPCWPVTTVLRCLSHPSRGSYRRWRWRMLSWSSWRMSFWTHQSETLKTNCKQSRRSCASYRQRSWMPNPARKDVKRSCYRAMPSSVCEVSFELNRLCCCKRSRRRKEDETSSAPK